MGVAGTLLMVSHTAVESSHLLCPLPAFHTASVPDWSTTPEPTTTSSLPPYTHTHQSCMFAASRQLCKGMLFLRVSQLCLFFFFFFTHCTVSETCKSVRKKQTTASHFCFFSLLICLICPSGSTTLYCVDCIV